MALTNAYTDEATFRDYMGLGTVGSTTVIGMAINAASRSIDAYCNRRFWLDPTPVARTFIPDSLIEVKLEADIGDLAVSVACDPSGDGTFDIAWSSTDFQLLPQNAPFEFPEAKPWDTLRAVGTRTFPWLVNTWRTRLDRVRVTARWGWPAVPANVTQACLLKAARLYHRKDSPQGVAGFGDLGAVRISAKDDPDVCLLLQDYGRWPVLVA